MPRRLICDAHEWINEIPTVSTYVLANLQPRERAWEVLQSAVVTSSMAGKEDPVELYSSLTRGTTLEV